MLLDLNATVTKQRFLRYIGLVDLKLSVPIIARIMGKNSTENFRFKFLIDKKTQSMDFFHQSEKSIEKVHQWEKSIEIVYRYRKSIEKVH